VIFGIFFVTSCTLSEPKVQKIDTFLSACSEKELFNGAVLIVENGDIIYHKTFGFASYSTREPLTKKSQFRLASVSKQFTAMAIMILKERGQLKYDDNIREYLPELPYKNIIIRNLLNHTSGLPEHSPLMEKYWDVEKKNQIDRKIATNEDVIALFAKIQPELLFDPGQQWKYCNTGYVFLASIVCRISGQSFREFLNQNIFKPAKMFSSAVFDPDDLKQLNHRVYGFRKYVLDQDYTDIDFHFTHGIAGDGGIYSTAEDLFKWDQILYTENLVSRTTLEEAFTKGTLNDGSKHTYGFGWYVDQTNSGKKVVRHAGGWVGFRTFIDREIDNKNVFIILTNNSNLYAREIREALINIFHERPFNFPKISIAMTIGPIIGSEGIDAALQTYRMLQNEHSDQYNFAEPIINFLGYQLVNRKKYKEAIKIFKLNVAEYPGSFNVYDSLAEAYMLDGQNEMAIQNFQKSLQINPENENARANLGRLSKNKKMYPN